MISRTQLTLEEFGKELRKQSRSNLTRNKKNVSKGLYKSIDYHVKEMQNSFEFSFKMEPYGDYVDKGVSGTKKKYDTPFAYTNKQPSIAHILPWVKEKRLYLRQSSGRFKAGIKSPKLNLNNQESLAFIIARKIKTQGQKPTHFYSSPFERLFKRLPKELIEAYQLDMRDLLSFSRQNKRLNDNG